MLGEHVAAQPAHARPRRAAGRARRAPRRPARGRSAARRARSAGRSPSCPAASRLTPKSPARRSSSWSAASCLTAKPTSGGSRESETSVPSVSPRRSPSRSTVMTATPAGNRRMTPRRSSPLPPELDVRRPGYDFRRSSKGETSRAQFTSLPVWCFPRGSRRAAVGCPGAGPRRGGRGRRTPPLSRSRRPGGCRPAEGESSSTTQPSVSVRGRYSSSGPPGGSQSPSRGRAAETLPVRLFFARFVARRKTTGAGCARAVGRVDPCGGEDKPARSRPGRGAVRDAARELRRRANRYG